MHYRIQKRRASSNIIERSKDGKSFEPFLAPLCKKEEGDILCEDLLYILKEN